MDKTKRRIEAGKGGGDGWGWEGAVGMRGKFRQV